MDFHNRKRRMKRFLEILDKVQTGVYKESRKRIYPHNPLQDNNRKTLPKQSALVSSAGVIELARQFITHATDQQVISNDQIAERTVEVAANSDALLAQMKNNTVELVNLPDVQPTLQPVIHAHLDYVMADIAKSCPSRTAKRAWHETYLDYLASVSLAQRLIQDVYTQSNVLLPFEQHVATATVNALQARSTTSHKNVLSPEMFRLATMPVAPFLTQNPPKEINPAVAYDLHYSVVNRKILKLPDTSVRPSLN